MLLMDQLEDSKLRSGGLSFDEGRHLFRFIRTGEETQRIVLSLTLVFG